MIAEHSSIPTLVIQHMGKIDEYNFLIHMENWYWDTSGTIFKVHYFHLFNSMYKYSKDNQTEC